MSELPPTQYLTIEVAFGEARKHLYTTDGESVSFHTNHEEAARAVRDNLQGGAKMMAMFKLEGVYRAGPMQVQEIK